MKFGSVCSGIEAVSVAWKPLGLDPRWFSEIEPYPCAVLDHHHPEAPNLGNMENLLDGRPPADIDVLVGGTPCQSFSVAGLGEGLDDDRGNLALVFCELARQLRPRWVVWENVPGVLSNDDGRAFGSILGALDKLGYGFAWRVLDAQHFGVPQRRRRVFVVGYLGDWRRAAAVLFEPESLRGNSQARPPSREDVAGTVTASAAKRRGSGQQPETLVNAEGSDGATLTAANLSKTVNNQTPLVFKPSHFTRGKDGAPAEIAPPLSADADKGDQDPLVFQSRYTRNGRGAPSKVAPNLTGQSGRTGKGDSAPLVFDPTQITHPENRTRDLDNAPSLGATTHAPTVAYHVRPSSGQGTEIRADETDVAYGVTAESDAKQTDRGTRVLQGAVRRLTPLECERLQGFPDGYTAIQFLGKPASDSQRYRALGNSMAVPVMRWLGARLVFVDQLEKTE